MFMIDVLDNGFANSGPISLTIGKEWIKSLGSISEERECQGHPLRNLQKINDFSVLLIFQNRFLGLQIHR